MSQLEKLKELQNKIRNKELMPNTEEATKQWFILPMFQILGYDIFSENVISEYGADFGNKKGERVDYCLRRKDGTSIIVECKDANAKLSNIHVRQLAVYYHNLSAQNEKPEFAILTNGVEYQVFKEAKENIMSDTPFLTINITTDEDYQLKKILDFGFEKSEETILEAVDTAKDFEELNSAMEEAEDYYNNTDNQDVMHQVSSLTEKIAYYRDLLEGTYYSGQLIDEDFNKLKIVIHDYIVVLSKIVKMQEKDIVCKKLGIDIDSTKLNVARETVLTGLVVDNKVRVELDTIKEYINRIKLEHGRENSSDEYIQEYLKKIDRAENYMEKELKWMMPKFAPQELVKKHSKAIIKVLRITLENIVSIEKDLLEYEKNVLN